MRFIIAIAMVLVAWAPCAGASADEAVERELKQDVVLRALVDELERGTAGLKLEDLGRPYFIEYALIDGTHASVSADLGAVAERDKGRWRYLRSAVRVGSYVLDNTNYGSGGRGRGAALPIEDDYNAIRQAIWWATDRQYKDVVETFEKKKAFMASRMIFRVSPQPSISKTGLRPPSIPPTSRNWRWFSRRSSEITPGSKTPTWAYRASWATST